MSLETEIRENGWTTVEFGMSEVEREEFAKLGRDLLLLASEYPELAEKLSFTLDPNLVVGGNNASFFGISGARNSADKKIWIHAGFQTRERLAEQAPKFAGVTEVADYLNGLDEVLGDLKETFIRSLGALSCRPDNIEPIFFPDDIMDTILHVRTVRYLDLDRADVGDEVIAGHGDMNFCTIQFYQTHKGYLFGAPVDPSMIRWDVLPDRIAYFQALYEHMKPLEYDLDRDAALFLSFAVAGADRDALEIGLNPELPALYHAGFLPEKNEPNVQGNWMLDNERIAVIGFLHPKLSVLQSPNIYRLPRVETCRPLLGITRPAVKGT